MPIRLAFLVTSCFISFHDVFCIGAYPAITQDEGSAMRTRLTPASVRHAQADADADRTIFWDTKTPGFGLQVTAAGHKSFVIQYRAKGRSRRMAIDGMLGLEAARKRAKALLGEVAHDRDPLGERRAALARERDTFQAIAESYFAREGKKLRTVEDRRQTMARLVYPVMGARPIADIRRSDIVRLLDRIEDKSGPVMAELTLAYIRKVMNWHASRSDEFRSPIVRGMARTSGKERARARILTDDELRAVWKAAEATAGPFGAFIKFLLLTGARRSEASDVTWDELEDGVWLLPAARNKVKQDLARPLSVTAQNLVDGLPKIGRYVFTFSGVKPLSGFVKPKARLDAACGVKDWTLHDLRRTARSLLSRAGIAPDVAERCLGHVIPGVRGVYDRHTYEPEMRHAFEALAAQILRIIDPQDNVVALRSMTP
jgi:integrase